jgi:arylsulfatase A-like enzyme
MDIENCWPKLTRRQFLKMTGALALGAAILGPSSCTLSLGGKPPYSRYYDFLAHFSEAVVEAPNPDYVKVEISDLVLFEHPPSQVTFSAVEVQQRGWLEFGIGLYEGAWSLSGDGVHFFVEVVDQAGGRHTVYERHLDPSHRPEDQGWFNESVDLSRFDGQRLQFIFRTEPGQNNQNDWAAWSGIRLVSQVPVQEEFPSRPNIILITIDTLRAGHLSCYGYPRQTSPTLDRLAQEGVRFASAYSHVELTKPSHETMLTGLYPPSHGVLSNRDRLALDVVTVPQRLQQLGYHTVGMVSGAHMGPEFGTDRGIDDFYVCPTVRRPAGDTTRIALEWLNMLQQEPFFMWIHYFDPHAPYLPPQPYNLFYNTADAPYRKPMADIPLPANWGDWFEVEGWPPPIRDVAEMITQYDGAIAYTDANIARLLACLDELGLSERTLLVVTADHGEGFGEHGVVFNHFGLHEEMLHVPLIMHAPGRLSAQEVTELVGHIDLGPTLLDLLGQQIPQEMPGVSLLPLMGGQRSLNRPGSIADQAHDLAIGIRTPEWRMILQQMDDTTWPLYNLQAGTVELYDLRADPGEQQNLQAASTGPALQAEQELSRHLLSWKQNTPVNTNVDTSPLDPELEEILRKLGY